MNFNIKFNDIVPELKNGDIITFVDKNEGTEEIRLIVLNPVSFKVEDRYISINPLLGVVELQKADLKSIQGYYSDTKFFSNLKILRNNEIKLNIEIFRG